MPHRTQPIFLALFFFVGLLVSPPATADIFGLEPGTRIRGHQGLDCDKCHTSGSGVARSKCLGCHDHRDLKNRIAAGKGLHARSDYKKGCEKCHLDHKGANYNPIKWGPLGGQKRFKHKLTGYNLEGAHKRVKCAECHKSRYKKSGRTKFLGLDSNCLSCHEDVHRFTTTNKKLTQCKICHSFDARVVAKAKGLPFKHGDVAKFPLNGKHLDTKCTKCHTSRTIFKMKKRPDRCVTCHKDVHKNVYTAKKRDCKACHSDKRFDFKRAGFDHNKKTRFNVRYAHAKQKCVKCHEPKKMTAPSMACAGCHESAHVVAGKDRFKGRSCQQCHIDKKFNIIRFNHARSAKFALGGKHGTVKCTGCHRVKPKAKVRTANDTFEYFRSASCVGCHSHRNSHKGAFNSRPKLCVKCHLPGSTNIKTPKHRELSPHFAQQGAHAKLQCAKCHGNSLARLKVGRDCVKCHKKDDAHKGNLGNTCKQCHYEGYPWTQVLFDHNRHSEFKLEGPTGPRTCTRASWAKAASTATTPTGMHLCSTTTP
jgi:hypothetical protein